MEDAAFSKKCNDKQILFFYLKISSTQNHKIPSSTATSGIVEDAVEPAQEYGVAVNRNTKVDAYFCAFRVTNLTKKHENVKS